MEARGSKKPRSRGDKQKSKRHPRTKRQGKVDAIPFGRPQIASKPPTSATHLTLGATAEVSVLFCGKKPLNDRNAYIVRGDVRKGNV